MIRNRAPKKLTLSRETLRNLDAGPSGEVVIWTDPTCSTCDPRKPCCP